MATSIHPVEVRTLTARVEGPWSFERIHRIRFQLIWVLLWMQVLDVVITLKVLGLGGEEMNPVAKFLIGSGVIWLFKLGIPLIMLWKWKTNRQPRFMWLRTSELGAMIAAAILTGMYATVMVVNTLALIKHS